jgi:hypothetical protein
MLLRNLINNVRRRSMADCLRHPVQFTALCMAGLFEQIGAWLLVPLYIKRLIEKRSAFFHRLIDEQRTMALWRLSDMAALKYLRFGFSLPHSLLFPLIKQPAYDVRPMLNRLAGFSAIDDCRVILRIDDVFLMETAVIERFIEVMRRQKIPYLAGVTGDDLLNPAFAPVIDRLRETGAEIAVHGFTHKGRFGPFESEILQMSYADLLDKLVAISGAAVFRNKAPLAFMPPYNAVCGEQISFLSHHFPVVTGGSETMRFSDHFGGPVAMKEGGWYVPATHPYYNKAKKILRRGLLARLARTKGFVCIALHMTEEKKDGFGAFNRLLDKMPIRPVSWQIFTKDNSGASYFKKNAKEL